RCELVESSLRYCPPPWRHGRIITPRQSSGLVTGCPLTRLATTTFVVRSRSALGASSQAAVTVVMSSGLSLPQWTNSSVGPLRRRTCAEETRGNNQHRPLFGQRGSIMSTFDPVCGIELEEAPAIAQLTYEGNRYFFCSESCRDEFLRRPEQYVVGAGPQPIAPT